jgi:FkbM family methyltransferase
MSVTHFSRVIEQGESAIRALMHSRPISFANFLSNLIKPGSSRQSLMWNGRPFYYRPGTSDVGAMLEILLPVEKRSIYRLDYAGKVPTVIFDIGANIGTSAIFFADKFPSCTIHAFEPEPNNYELLCKNTSHFKNIVSYPFALGSTSEFMPLYENVDPANPGGFSLLKDGIESNGKQSGVVAVRNIGEVIREIGVSRIDLIKIDTEGAEYDILTSIPIEILDKVQWIVGELHSVKDWELLDFLSKRFEIGMTRFRETRLSIFQAYRSKTSPAR